MYFCALNLTPLLYCSIVTLLVDYDFFPSEHSRNSRHRIFVKQLANATMLPNNKYNCFKELN